MAKKKWTEEELSNKIVVSDPMLPAEEQEVLDLLIRCRIQTMLGYPFFGYLVMHLELEKDYTIATAATNGDIFYYNPYFIKALSEPERLWVMIHEVMHAALKHIWRCGSRIPKIWNLACDYAIHSIMMQFLKTSTTKRKDNLRMPQNALYDTSYDDMPAEYIYAELLKKYNDCDDDDSEGDDEGSEGDGSGSGSGNNGKEGSNGKKGKRGKGSGRGRSKLPETLDDHSKWYNDKTRENSSIKEKTWDARLVSAAQVMSSKNCGNLPGFLQRLINKIVKPQKDWRSMLAEFVEWINDDYSFLPPDTRYDTDEFGGIMLPAFSDQTEFCRNIIFYVDTSGSIGDKELKLAYSEIVGAIEQFKGKLTGKIGFFDSKAYPLTDFEDVQDVLKIKPMGGGGTDFDEPFIYVKDKVPEDEVAGIVILTDGYCDWPNERLANNKPVLWIINNEDRTPPWGRIARLDIRQEES